MIDLSIPLNTSSFPNSDGILIKFCRRLISIPENRDTSEYEYIVWGYFDWIKFEQGKKSLLEFYVENNSGQRIEQDYEEQVICIYPASAGEFIITEKNLSTKPLIVISEIKLFDENIKNFDLQDTIDTLTKTIHDNFPKINFQFFYSLGYSDLVIIFVSQSYDTIMNALILLRRDQSVKSIYSIHGMGRKYVASWEEKKFTHASIFISTKSGTNFSELSNAIKQELHKTGYDFNVVPLPLFGKYDLEMRITPPAGEGFQQIANLFLPKPIDFINDEDIPDNLLCSSNNFFNKHINYTRTRWFSDFDSSETLCEGNEQDSQNANPSKSLSSKKFKTLWNKSLQITSNQESKNNYYPLSLTLALQDVLKYYWQIENNETASPLLQNELYKLLNALYETIEKDMSSTDEQNKENIDIDSLELAVHLFSDLLQNWVQATRMVFEGPNYNIKFVNSSTKIYISYFTIVEIIESELEIFQQGKKNKNKEYSKLLFFPTINFTDLVKSHVLFPNSTFAREKIIPIRFDKLSFFSPVKSIPWLFHEMGHYIQIRNVAVRNTCFLRTICMDIARKIFMYTVVDSENSYLLDKFKNKWYPIASKSINDIEYILEDVFTQKLCSYMSEQSLDNFVEKISQVIESGFSYVNEEIDNLSKKISSEFVSIKHSNKISIENYNCFEKLLDWLFEGIENGKEVDKIIFFWKESNDFENLPPSFFEIIQLIVTQYKLRKKEIESLCTTIGDSIFKNLYKDDNNEFFDTLQESKNQTWLLEYANFFAKQGLIENTTRNKKEIIKTIHSIIKSQNLSKEVGIYHDFFKETTADLFMIKILGLDESKYNQIIENAEERIENFGSVAKAQNQSILMRTRQNTICTYILRTERKISRTTDSWQYKTLSSGLYDEELGKYLRSLSSELDIFVMSKNISDIRYNFNKYIGGNKKADGFTNEIRFIEEYWKKGLLMLDRK